MLAHSTPQAASSGVAMLQEEGRRLPGAGFEHRPYGTVKQDVGTGV